MSDDRVLQLQEKLTEAYRLKAEHTGELLRLKEQAEKDEKLIVEKDEQLARRDKTIAELQELLISSQAQVAHLTENATFLKKEGEKYRSDYLTIEQRFQRIKEENDIMLAQILRLKNEQASEMNHMNEALEAMKRRSSEAEASAAAAAAAAASSPSPVAERKLAAPTDLSDSSILDAMAWSGNFNITIPAACRRIQRAHDGQATSCRFNSAATLLATSGADAMIRVWDSRSGVLRGMFRGAKGSVLNLEFSYDDAILAGTCNDNVALLWSMKTSKSMVTLSGHKARIQAVAFASDHETLFTGSHDRTIKLWNIGSGANTLTQLCQSACNAIAVSPNGNLVASAHLDNHIRFWVPKTCEELKDLPEVHMQQATSVDFSQDGTMVVTNSRDNSLQIIDIRTFKVLKTLKGTDKDPYVNGVNWGRACFSHDGQYVVAGSSNGALYFWSVLSGKLESVVKPTVDTAGWSTMAASGVEGAAVITGVSWGRGGKGLASVNSAGFLSFWE